MGNLLGHLVRAIDCDVGPQGQVIDSIVNQCLEIMGTGHSVQDLSRVLFSVHTRMPFLQLDKLCFAMRKRGTLQFRCTTPFFAAVQRAFSNTFPESGLI